MIVILKHNDTDEKRDQLINWFKSQGLGVDVSKGEYQTILGLIGDVLSLDTDMIESLDIVQATRRVTEPFKRCNRKFQPNDTVIQIGDASIGGGNFAFITGPSSIESEEQLLKVAESVKASGADILTGGSISSKTASHNLQKKNLAELEHLKAAKQTVGMPAGKELISVEDVPNYEDLDILIIGERNMANYPLLAAAAESGKTIILKRSVSATLEELLMSAEYIMAGGNKNIILCERGLRTFAHETKATFDISAIPEYHQISVRGGLDHAGLFHNVRKHRNFSVVFACVLSYVFKRGLYPLFVDWSHKNTSFLFNRTTGSIILIFWDLSMVFSHFSVVCKRHQGTSNEKITQKTQKTSNAFSRALTTTEPTIG